MSITLIKNARVVNEGQITETDVRIVGQRIDAIDSNISPGSRKCTWSSIIPGSK